ncbi:hypothetical protein MASR2M15_07230 [Anaerolineales bacterium]
MFILFLSRVILFNQLELNHDEVWHIWQTSDSLENVFRWLPYDWPPLYFILMWGWQNLVGMHPFVHHLMSTLIFMLAAALMYQLAFKIFAKSSAAWAAMLIYSALGFTIFLSVYVRPYVFMLLLLPATLYAMILYFESRKWVWGLWTGLGMAAMFLTNLTALLAFIVLGLYSLLIYPRQLLRWFLPAFIAFLVAFPEILSKFKLMSTRNAGQGDALIPLGEGLVNLFRAYTGYAAPLWAIALLLLLFLLLLKRQLFQPKFLILLIWVLFLPIFVYFSDHLLGFFLPRYSWWITVGLALLMAGAMAYLPGWLYKFGAFLLIIAMFLPISGQGYGFRTLPFEATFRDVLPWLRPDQRILIDPACADCGSPMEWDYYQQIFAPHGLNFVEKPEKQGSIWYISSGWGSDESMKNRVADGRVFSRFAGPWDFLWELYEAPPDSVGILYENGMRFHGIQVLNADGQIALQPLVRREGESVRLRLWWSIDQILEADYSVSVQIAYPDGSILSQSDSAPQTINLHPMETLAPPQETSQWQLNQYYIEERTLEIPYPIDRFDHFSINLIVYQWWDGLRIKSAESDAEGVLPLMPFAIMAW